MAADDRAGSFIGFDPPLPPAGTVCGFFYIGTFAPGTVRSSARTVAQATQGAEFPFPIICDAPGVLYSYLGVEQARGLRSWSFAAQRIYKTAKEQGYRYDSSAPQILPLTLVVGHLGKILFIHSGRSQTDLPEDCTAIREIAREVASTLAAGPEGPRTRCSDETLTLPDLVGWDDGDNDR